MSTRRHTSQHSAQLRRARLRKPPPRLRLLRWQFRILGPLFPHWMAQRAYRLWFSVQHFPPPPRELAVISSARHEQRLLRGHEIAVYHWGVTGPTVLLAHGWNGRGSQLGSFVQPLLDAGYRVLSFDAPAHGQSPGRQTTIFEIATVMQALTEQCGPIHAIIAHSFAVPCTLLALQQGMALEKVVGISPPASLEGLIDKFSTALHIPPIVDTHLRKRILQRFGKRTWTCLSPLHIAEHITTPALIIHDKDDIDVSWEEGQKIAAHWPGTQFILTNGLGHRRILRANKVIQQAVAFINQKNNSPTL